MRDALALPSAGADPVELADWVELEALQSNDGYCSLQTLASQLRITGSTDVLVEDEADPCDPGGEESYDTAADAWAELERRTVACGGDDGAFPFVLTASSIARKDGWESSSYAFQLLLSQYGIRVGETGSKPERIFEALSAVAGANYLGSAEAKSYRFGSPREDGSGFCDALERVCRELCEGQVNRNAERLHTIKDDGVDVIVWRPFRDSQPSQILGFGQCAAGKDWWKDKKRADVDAFMKSWMRESFHTTPVKMFFLPHCIEASKWRLTSVRGGIVFDRCRIADLTREWDQGLREKASAWTQSVAENQLGRR